MTGDRLVCFLSVAVRAIVTTIPTARAAYDASSVVTTRAFQVAPVEVTEELTTAMIQTTVRRRLRILLLLRLQEVIRYVCVVTMAVPAVPFHWDVVKAIAIAILIVKAA